MNSVFQGRPVVAVFSTPWASKFNRLRPLIAELAARGMNVHVFTDRRFAGQVARAGARFVDIYGAYPIDAADAESIPLPCRHVTYAATYADQISAEVRGLGAQLIIHESYALIGWVVARILELPRVTFRSGHYADPEEVVAWYESDGKVQPSPACRHAVDTLREAYGLANASPFVYLSTTSPLLNLYGEPPQWLSAEGRAALEPVMFYGSLPDLEEIQARRCNGGPGAWVGRRDDQLRIYAAFGTQARLYWPDLVLDTLAGVSEAVSGMSGATALISLGDARLGYDPIPTLSRPGVRVAGFVDQWKALAGADLFVTHHGLYSTHEAIVSGVPMLGYPFFADQPALAAECVERGMSVPLVERPRDPLMPSRLLAAIEEVGRRGESMRASLDRAYEWELEVLTRRGEIAERVVGLI